MNISPISTRLGTSISFAKKNTAFDSEDMAERLEQSKAQKEANAAQALRAAQEAKINMSKKEKEKIKQARAAEEQARAAEQDAELESKADEILNGGATNPIVVVDEKQAKTPSRLARIAVRGILPAAAALALACAAGCAPRSQNTPAGNNNDRSIPPASQTETIEPTETTMDTAQAIDTTAETTPATTEAVEDTAEDLNVIPPNGENIVPGIVMDISDHTRIEAAMYDKYKVLENSYCMGALRMGRTWKYEQDKENTNVTNVTETLNYYGEGEAVPTHAITETKWENFAIDEKGGITGNKLSEYKKWYDANDKEMFDLNQTWTYDEGSDNPTSCRAQSVKGGYDYTDVYEYMDVSYELDGETITVSKPSSIKRYDNTTTSEDPFFTRTFDYKVEGNTLIEHEKRDDKNIEYVREFDIQKDGTLLDISEQKIVGGETTSYRLKHYDDNGRWIGTDINPRRGSDGEIYPDALETPVYDEDSLVAVEREDYKRDNDGKVLTTRSRTFTPDEVLLDMEEQETGSSEVLLYEACFDINGKSVAIPLCTVETTPNEDGSQTVTKRDLKGEVLSSTVVNKPGDNKLAEAGNGSGNG